MSDTISRKKRSQIMKKIKCKESNLELNFKHLMTGFRFRYHPKMFGNPDFAYKKLKVAIFIDSCFWHKCPMHFRNPNSNKSYWNAKLDRNVERAKEVNSTLKKFGWKVIRLWEHNLIKNPNKCINKVKSTLGLE